jgi:hypothetical protein
VCLVIRSYLQPRMMPWFDCDHMGLVVRGPDGSLNLLHSAPPSVQREGIVRFLQKFPHVAGFRFLRIRPNAVATSDLEINRLHDSIQVPEAAVQDVRNASLRQERIGPVIEQQ